MNLRHLVLTIALLIIPFSFSQAKTKTAPRSAASTASDQDNSISFKEQAEKEIDAPEEDSNKNKNWDKDSPSGFLKLEDPGLQTSHRSYNWLTRLQARSTQLSGAAVIIPELELGFQKDLRDAFWGFEGMIGATSRNSSYTFSTGYKVDDVKIVSQSLGGKVFYGITRQKWNFSGGLGWIQLSQNQTSSFDSARFNHSLRTLFASLGIDRRMGAFELGLDVNYLAKNSSDDLATDSLQPVISASYLW